jgi:hypothetical protein
MPYIGSKPSTANFSDLNGAKLIIDADADTTITADTVDQIDIEIAGADDFQFTANTFTAAASSVIALDDGAVATPSLTTTGDLNTGVYFPAADTVGVTAGGVEKFRFGSNKLSPQNLLVNGAMNVAQRGTVTGLGGVNGARTAIDMWLVDTDGASNEGRFSVLQNATTPVGFGNSLWVDCTTAESAVAAGDLNVIQTRNEAQDLQQLDWGTAAAKDVTLSFWYRSAKTGTHCVMIYAEDSNRSMVKEFTIASAGGFEYFSLTFAGDTGGTAFADDTGAGFRVGFPLVCGSNYQISADTWTANNRYATSNQQNLLDSTSGEVLITGVSLVVGGAAGDFEHEDYGTTLRKCQRYLHRIERLSSTNHLFSVGKMSTTTSVEFVVQHPVTMRASGTMSLSAVDDFYLRRLNTQTACTNLVTLVTGIDYVSLTATVSSGLTAGQVCILYLEADGDFIQWSAEL